MLGMKSKKSHESETKSRKRAEFVAELRTRLLKVAEAAADEALEQVQDLIIRRVEKAEVRAEARMHTAARRPSTSRTHTPEHASNLGTTSRSGGRRRRGGRKTRR